MTLSGLSQPPSKWHLSTLLQDWRGQMSWGRVCAVVALIKAWIVQTQGGDVPHVALWLGVATGNYGLAKITEMIGMRVAAPSAPGSNATTSGCAEAASTSADGGQS